MPISNNHAQKKPGALAWIGFSILAFLIIIIALSVLSSFFSFPKKSINYTADYQTISSGISAGVPMAPNMARQELSTEKLNDSAMPMRDGATSETIQRVIKTGELSLRVEDASKAIENIRLLVAAKNGFVESSSISDSGTGPRNAWLTVRIPSNNFEDTLSAIKSVGVLVQNESISGQDVTEEFIDLEADIRNAKAEESSYLEIMKRSGKIEEVLQVAQSLANVRGRIERLEGRKRFLENKTEMASININLTEQTRIEIPSRTWKPYEVLKQSISELIESLQALVDFLIRAAIAILGLLLPILAIATFILWIGWKIIKFLIKRLRS